MGIDAEILVRRVPRHYVTDEWLRAISWRICEAIGAEHFFTSDGLLPDEYAKANKAWHAAFKAHPLHSEFENCYARGSGELVSPPGAHERAQEIRGRIVGDIGEHPKDRRLAIEPTMTHYREDDDPPPGSLYYEDAEEPIRAEGDECLLKLSLFGRYYGPGYERGDLLTYCAIAEWLEVNIPGCEVWYGGDSSGVCAKPFHERARRELRMHLFSPRGRDYFARGNPFMRDEGYGTPPACSRCPLNKYHGSRCGFGNRFAVYNCAGCGISHETRDGGKTWQERKERD